VILGVVEGQSLGMSSIFSKKSGQFHHHCDDDRVASMAVAFLPVMRLMVLCHRSAREAPEFRRIWDMLQLLRGRPGPRFQEWWGGPLSDASTWQHVA